MAKGQYHIGKNGPGLCSADPSKPGGRSCRYEADGHYLDFQVAESVFAAQMEELIAPPAQQRGRAKPTAEVPVAKLNDTVFLPAEDVLDRRADDFYGSGSLRAIRQYRDGANWTINGMLRKGDSPTERDSEFLRSFDGIFEQVEPLRAPIQLQRSLEADPEGKSYGIPSSGIYSDPAYLSCSSSREFIERSLIEGVTEGISVPSDTILSIDVPRGARVFALSLDDEDYTEEAEVILPRESKLEILEDSGFVDGVRRVRARLVLEE